MSGDSRNPRLSLLKKYDIPVEHLSYDYVEKCNEKKVLERIVRILRSGEEGFYPDLLKTAEEKLRSIAPESRVLRVETPILTKDSLTNEEWNAVESELLSWEEEMKIVDKSLDFEKDRIEIVGNRNMPSVRKTIEPKPNKETQKLPSERNKSERIKSGDYCAWDKFDVDKELLKIDIEEEKKQEENEKKKREIKRAEKNKKCDLQDLDKESYSILEQQVLANQAKDRGNECFKSGDYANALKYYDISIKLYVTANAYNNRAMTYLKLNEFEKAIQDCNTVLGMERNNIKALHRRATAYQNLSDGSNNYNELAFQDLNLIVTLEPNNKTAQADLQKLKKKLHIEDIGKKFRMPIYENIQDFYKKELDNRIEERNSLMNFRDFSSKTDELPLTYYGPSTSTFLCEPYSMTHRELSGSFLPNYIMCKCNSNRTRQNPLCQKCGEALCTPKPTSKKPTTTAKAESNSKKNKESINTSIIRQTNQEKILNSESNSDNNNINLEEVERVHVAKSSSATAECETSSRTKNIASGDNNLKSPKGTENQINEPGDADKNIIFPNTTIRLDNSFYKKDSVNSIDNVSLNAIDVNHKDNVLNNVSKNIESLSNDLNSKILANDNENCNSNKDSDLCHTSKTEVTDLEYNKNKTNKIKSSNSDSSQNDGKNSAKKLKSKKKKSKEHKENRKKKQIDVIEPLRVVHAEKYLHPTSVEPKIKSETSKSVEPKTSLTTPTQFKAFTPNRKCLSIQKDEGCLSKNYSPPCDSFRPNSSKIISVSEGNKENILDVRHINNEEENEEKLKKSKCEFRNNVVESAFEFIKNWEELRKVDSNFTKRAEIIRSIKPSDLGKVIGIKLDSDMLSSLLECLDKHFVETDPNVVVEFLKQLPQIPRFGIIKMFLADADKKVLKKLVETAEGRGFTLDEELKNILKVAN